MLGRRNSEVFPEFTGSELESASRRAMNEGATVLFEEYCAPLDRWFEQTVYPAFDGVTVDVRDVTSRKQMIGRQTGVGHPQKLQELLIAMPPATRVHRSGSLVAKKLCRVNLQHPARRHVARRQRDEREAQNDAEQRKRVGWGNSD
jgi:PAS fold